MATLALLTAVDGHLEPCAVCGEHVVHVTYAPGNRESGLVPYSVVCPRCGNRVNRSEEAAPDDSDEKRRIMDETGCDDVLASLARWWNGTQRSMRYEGSDRGVDHDAYLCIGDVDDLVQQALDERWDAKRLAYELLLLMRCGEYPD